MIELISGQRLDAYLRETVLQALGMAITRSSSQAEQSKRFAANYQRQADDSLKLIDDPAKSLYRDGASSPVAADWCPRPQLLRFASMMLTKASSTAFDCCDEDGRAHDDESPSGRRTSTTWHARMFTETAYAGVASV